MDAMDEAVSLIKHLNDPAFASHATDISQRLQQLQLSPAGWNIGDGLLSSNDSTLQFFGALTFQVRMNRDAGNLDDEQADQVYMALLRSFARLSSSVGPARTVDKLCSALATFSMQIRSPRSHMFYTAMAFLRSGQMEAMDQAEVTLLVSQLQPSQLLALLRLTTVMAEDLGKNEGDSLGHHHIEQAFRTSVPVIVALLNHALGHGSSPDIMKQGLQAYTAISLYAISRWSHQVETWASLQAMSDLVIGLFSDSSATIVASAADALASVMSQTSKFLTRAQSLNLVPTLLAANQRDDLDEEELLSLLKLTTAWAKANVSEFLQHPDQDMYQALMGYLISSIYSTNWAEDGCEKLYSITDFWLDFTDQLADLGDASDEQSRQLHAVVSNVIQAYFATLDRKDDATMADIDPDYISDWHRIRQDFVDLMLQCMAIPYVPVYQMCADQLDQALLQHNWSRIESVVQLLNEIADEYESQPRSEEQLARIFDSSFFSLILNSDESDKVAIRLKRQLVKFIDHYSFFFKHHTAQIPTIMTILMKTLEANLSHETKLADLAAKCIASLCSSCRSVLVAMLDSLLSFCERALTSHQLSAYHKEKIYSGMAFVIQAIPDESAKVFSVSLLVTQLHNDVQEARSLVNNGQQEEGEQRLVTSFQCLAATGKALHSGPTHISLDDDDNDTRGPPPAIDPWAMPAGAAITAQILSSLQHISSATANGEAWDALFSVLRVGLSEPSSPFLLPASATVSFLTPMAPAHPRLETLLTTACAFVSSSSARPPPSSTPDSAPLLSASTGLIQTLQSAPQGPHADPQLSALLTGLLDRLLLLPPHPALRILSGPSLGCILDFELAALAAPATTPQLKRAAASFLASFLSLPSTLRSPNQNQFRDQAQTQTQNQTQNQSQDQSQDQIQIHTSALAPPLATVLTSQILFAAAARSELDAAARVLRALVLHVPGWRGCMEAAITNENAARGRGAGVDGEQRRWLARVTLLRGGRGTVEAVRDVWARARGTVGAF